jgi:hypothetical protein
MLSHDIKDYLLNGGRPMRKSSKKSFPKSSKGVEPPKVNLREIRPTNQMFI